MITQGELESLPEIDGVPLYQKDDDGSVTDVYGVLWMIGWHNGVRVKQRMMSQLYVPRP